MSQIHISIWDICRSQIELCPKSQFGISQIMIWCIIPNRNFGYPKSWFSALSQIVIWCIFPNCDLVHYPKLRFGALSQSRFGALSQSRFGALLQIMIWWIILNHDLVHYPKSWFGIFQIAILDIPNHDLVHCPKLQFGVLSQIAIWCIVPNCDLVHIPKLWFGTLFQIVIWCTFPNHDLVYFQIAIWDISNYNLKYCNLEQKYNLNDYLIFFLIYNIYNFI